jgi:hypothetical protein
MLPFQVLVGVRVSAPVVVVPITNVTAAFVLTADAAAPPTLGVTDPAVLLAVVNAS